MVDVAWSKPGSPRAHHAGAGVRLGGRPRGRGRSRALDELPHAPGHAGNQPGLSQGVPTLRGGRRIQGADSASKSGGPVCRDGCWGGRGEDPMGRASFGVSQQQLPELGPGGGSPKGCWFDGVTGSRDPGRNRSQLPAALGKQDPVAPHKLLFSWPWRDGHHPLRTSVTSK